MAGRLRPIKQVELESKNLKLRVILLVVCLLIATVSIGFGIKMLVTRQNGWQTVEVASNDIHCGDDFTLQFYFGKTEMSATQEYRAVNALYSQACQQAYQSFYPDGELKQISAAANEEVAISQPLYNALSQVEKYGSRYLYMAPIYGVYNQVFLCDTELEASWYDPSTDPEQQQWLAQLASYCNDPQMIRLELLGENKVKLVVSQQYLAFAAENEIQAFLDFGWLQSAFAADYIADTLEEAGYTRGYLVSYDGFTRNMDDSNYTQNLFQRLDNDIHLPATVSYDGPSALVYLRSYPMNETDRQNYFAFADGHVVSAMVDPVDGANRFALPELLAYGKGKSCGEIALQLAPVFIAEVLDAQALIDLGDQEIYTVFAQDKNICHTQKNLAMDVFEAGYTAKYLGQ